MKKTGMLLVLLYLFAPAFAIIPMDPSPTPVRASAVMFQVGPQKQWISLEELANMHPREYARITHQHMNFFERAQFVIAQNNLRKSILPDGTVNNKKLMARIAPGMDGKTGFHLGGFALGLFLGLAGILIAFLINDDKKANRLKWALIALAGLIVLIGVVIIIAMV